MKIAIFPGSFDPVTKGHLAVINAALPLFDKIYIAIGANMNKRSLFPIEKRKAWIERCFVGEKRVEVLDYSGLTIDLCHQLKATYIIRGIRNALDFQYENDIAHANKQLAPNIETIFFSTELKYSHISSSVVRDLYTHHSDCSDFIPEFYDIYE